jgi:molybdate transport system substrate-binding protein
MAARTIPRRMVRRRFVASGVRAVAGAAIASGLPSVARAAQGDGRLTVFAAISLKEALDEIVRAYEARSGERVTLVYAGTPALARQIEQGAPADLFVSADREWMDHLAARGLVDTGSRTDLVGNALVLIGSTIDPARDAPLRIAPGFDLATPLRGEWLAMADPDTVPAGRYARAALQKLGVWEQVRRRVVRAENVRVALALVGRGEAPLGIVYRTDALAEPSVRILDTFPADSHPPIVYPAARIAASRAPGALALLRALAEPDARRVWERRGFVPRSASR